MQMEQIIEERVRYWIDALMLNNWTVSVEMRHEACADDRHDRVTPAMAEVSWPYLDATIIFYLPSMEGRSDADIDCIILHELLHLILRPMDRFVLERDITQHIMSEEVTVSWLTRIIFRLNEMAASARRGEHG